MPRFLAVNYLTEALQRHKTMLGHMLLTEPHHLDKVETYPHSGIVRHETYRQPWIRGKANDIPLSEDLQGMFNQLVSNTENYEEVEHINRMYEVVPSSNPESQYSIEEDIINKVDEIHYKQNGYTNELFEKQDFIQWHKDQDKKFNKQTKLGDGFKRVDLYLEEVSWMDPLSAFLTHLPKLTTMCERLAPKSLTDPLATGDGNAVTEEMILSHDKLYNTLECLKKPDFEGMKENFEMHNLYSGENDMIEEELSGIFTPSTAAQEAQCSTTNRELKTLLHLHIEPLEKNIQQEFSLDMQSLELCTNKSISQMGDSMEKLNEGPKDTIRVINFTEINDNDETDEHLIENALLESPTEKENVTSKARPGIQDLKPFDVPSDDSVSILSPTGKEEVTAKLWQTEKYFSDILALHLPEKEERPSRFDWQCIQEGIYHLGLKREACGGELELSLPWDPIAESLPMTTKLSKLESFGRDIWLDKDSAQNADSMHHEVFTKYDINHTVQDGNDLLKNTDEVGLPPRMIQKQSSRISGPSGRNTSHQDLTIPVTTSKEGKTNAASKSNFKPFIPKVGVNPLEDFLLMRSAVQKGSCLSNNNRNTPIKVQVGAGKVPCKVTPSTPRKSLRKPETLTESETPITPGDRESKRRSKCKVIQVHLTDSFKRIVSLFKENSQPMLTLLKQKGLIPSTHMFEFFTPDITKFIVKQHEKAQKDSGTDEQSRLVYRAVVSLHALVSSSDVLQHCCLHSSIAHLSSTKDSYEAILEGSLEGIHHQILQVHHLHMQKGQTHPKIYEMCSFIGEWFIKKRQKSPGHDPKILVISRRQLETLTHRLQEAMGSLPGITPTMLNNTQQASYQHITNYLDNHNCVIVFSKQIREDFPWAQFSLVVEYEYRPEDITLKDLCARQNIRYIGLQTVAIKQPQKDADITVMQAMHQTNLKEKDPKQDTYTFIGSQEVTGNTMLLHLLEARHDIVIVECDYHQLTAINKDSTSYCYADVIIDERCGVVLQDLSGLKEEYQLEPVVKRVAALSLQYETCWVILYANTKQGRNIQYCYAGSTTSNIANLHASVGQFSRDKDKYEVKILISSNEEETASIIRHIGEKACMATVTWTPEDWTHRQWLTGEMHQEEKLLLSFPCINAFSAKLLLIVGPLHKLLTMSVQDLTKACPWLPHKVILAFHDLGHNRALMNTMQQAVPDQVYQHSSRLDSTPLSAANDSVTKPVNSDSWTGQPQSPLPKNVYRSSYSGGTDIHDNKGLQLSEGARPGDTDAPDSLLEESQESSQGDPKPNEYELALLQNQNLYANTRDFFTSREFTKSSKYCTGKKHLLRSEIGISGSENHTCDENHSVYDLRHDCVGYRSTGSHLRHTCTECAYHSQTETAKQQYPPHAVKELNSTNMSILNALTCPEDFQENTWSQSRTERSFEGAADTVPIQTESDYLHTEKDLWKEAFLNVGGKDHTAGYSNSYPPKDPCMQTDRRNPLKYTSSGHHGLPPKPGFPEPEPSSNAYRSYVGRKNIKLWTEFGDKVEKLHQHAAVMKQLPVQHPVKSSKTNTVAQRKNRIQPAVVPKGAWTNKAWQPEYGAQSEHKPVSYGMTPGYRKESSHTQPPSFVPPEPKYTDQMTHISNSDPGDTKMNKNHARIGLSSVSQLDFNEHLSSHTSVPSKTPSIAPVTPRVRQPLQALDLGFTNQNYSFGGMQNVSKTSTQTQVLGYQSPPMDLDSDEDELIGLHIHMPGNRTSHFQRAVHHMHDRKDHNVPQGFSGGLLHKGDIHKSSQTRDELKMIMLAPSKKRRLTFEKVPGTNDGQTRLSFQ